MKIVNGFFLDALLDPLCGLGDSETAVLKYADLNPNDEESVRSVIRNLIVPATRKLSEKKKEQVRLACQYYLTKGGINFNRVFESILPPFGPPDDVRKFFEWTWEECFPDESYILSNLEEYEEHHDANEVWKIDLNN